MKASTSQPRTTRAQMGDSRSLLDRLGSRRWPSRTPWLILGLAMVCSAAAVLWVTRGVGFLGDEWGFYASYPGFDLKEMLGPRVGHLQVVLIVLYKGVIELWGPSDVAFRLILVALILLLGGLVYELVRRRVGDWLALGPAVLVLSFGAGGEAYASTLGIAIVLTIVAGLAMLLCLERRDLAGDIGACLLLAAALATYAPAVAFLAGAAAVILLAGERPEWRRTWVFGVPLLLYLAWRLWSPPGLGDEPRVTLVNLLHLPNSILESIAAALAAMTGLIGLTGNDAPGVLPLGWGQALLALLVIGTVLLLRRRRGLVDRWIWAALAMPLVYWAAIGAVSSAARTPAAARYQLLSAIFIILVYAQLAAGVRLSSRAVAVILAAFGLAALGNIGALETFGQRLRANSDQNRAQLAALELIRDRVDPRFVVESTGPTISLPDMLIPAGQYFAATDAHGSPAMSLARLRASPEHVRKAADAALIRALRLAPRPLGGPLQVGGALSPGAATGFDTQVRGPCLHMIPRRPGAASELSLPPGGFSVRPDPGSPPELSLLRFAGRTSRSGRPRARRRSATQLPSPATTQTQVVKIPPDSSNVPWRLQLVATAPLTLCPLRPA